MSTPLPGSGVAPTITSGTPVSGAGSAGMAGGAAQAVIPIRRYAVHFDPNARIVDAVLHPSTTFQQADSACVQELIPTAGRRQRNIDVNRPAGRSGQLGAGVLVAEPGA